MVIGLTMLYRLKTNGFLRGKSILNNITSVKRQIAEISEVILQELFEYKKIYPDFTFILIPSSLANSEILALSLLNATAFDLKAES